MSERDMVMDILYGVKAGIGSYAKAITECGDLELRQTLQQMCNADEQFQYELYTIALQKGYYIPGPKAAPQDLQSLKNQLNQALSEVKNAAPTPVLQ